MVLCLRKRKKKIIYFHFYLMFPNIKKVKILTPIISNETMQSNSKCIQQPPAPSVLLLYTTVESTPKNPLTCLVGKFHVFTKTKKPNNMQNSCYLVSASQFTNLVLRRHMGLQFYLSNFIQLPHRKHK